MAAYDARNRSTVMSPWYQGTHFWTVIAIACGLIALFNILRGIVRRLLLIKRSKSLIKIKIGSKTFLFDVDEPAAEIEARLTEALEESAANGTGAL
jgi:hypothetical protein